MYLPIRQAPTSAIERAAVSWSESAVNTIVSRTPTRNNCCSLLCVRFAIPVFRVSDYVSLLVFRRVKLSTTQPSFMVRGSNTVLAIVWMELLPAWSFVGRRSQPASGRGGLSIHDCAGRIGRFALIIQTTWPVVGIWGGGRIREQTSFPNAGGRTEREWFPPTHTPCKELLAQLGHPLLSERFETQPGA